MYTPEDEMPRGKQNGLTTARIKSVVKPGVYADGGGLYLKVVDSGARRWVFRGRLNGQPVARGLGGFPAVGLADARERAREYRQMVRDGVDPAAAKRDRAKAVKGIPTVKDVAASVWELRRNEWTQQHTREWWQSLETHALPQIGGMAVNEVSAADVLAVLEPIWNTKRETATRVRQRIEAVMDYAVASGHRADNPVSATRRALPAKRPAKAHFEALPYAELPEPLNIIRTTGNRITSLAVEFVVLTAARSGEVRGATWGEIDLDAAVWELPAERMKARRPHRVPLSAQGVAVLVEAGELTGRSGLVFPSARSGKSPLTPQALSRVLARGEIGGTIHGMRSTFRDWAAEQSGASWAVCESALAHSIGSSTEQAYARTDYLESRKELMQAWATFCAGATQRGFAEGGRSPEPVALEIR
jgi:integrase